MAWQRWAGKAWHDKAVAGKQPANEVAGTGLAVNQLADNPTGTGLAVKQLADNPTGTGLAVNSQQMKLPAPCLEMEVGGGSAVMLATQKAGSDLPYGLPPNLSPLPVSVPTHSPNL